MFIWTSWHLIGYFLILLFEFGVSTSLSTSTNLIFFNGLIYRTSQWFCTGPFSPWQWWCSPWSFTWRNRPNCTTRQWGNSSSDSASKTTRVVPAWRWILWNPSCIQIQAQLVRITTQVAAIARPSSIQDVRILCGAIRHGRAWTTLMRARRTAIVLASKYSWVGARIKITGHLSTTKQFLLKLPWQ